LREALKTVKILFRAPDTLTLYGIPYGMRPGQQPGDLWRAHRDYVPPKLGHYGPNQIDIADWIWLGTPGWFGNMNPEEIQTVQAFLAEKKVPGNPYEWDEL
jgi:hypothetical protein